MQKLLTLYILLFSLSAYAQDDKYLVNKFDNHKGEVRALGFSPSGKYLATGGEDKKIFIINMETQTTETEIADNYYPVYDLQFYGENKMFITSGNDIKLIDFNNNKLALYEGNTTYFWSLDFAPERDKITGGSYDRKIHVWDVSSQQMELTLEGHEKSTLPVVFSPDEKYIVSGSLDLTIKVWNAKTGDLLKSLEKHTENIYDIAFHPNARYFASASGDKTIRLWDIETGHVIKTYAGHEGGVVGIEFSPDGYFLYSASVDGTAIVWEVSTGAKLYDYILHKGAVNAVTASSDGKYVATGGKDGMVYLWQSGKYIAVDNYYSDDLNSDIAENPIFEPKKKDETKQTYADRQKEAAAQKDELIDKYFEKYRQRMNYKNLPTE